MRLVAIILVLGGWLPGLVFSAVSKWGLPFARQAVYDLSMLWMLGMCLLVVKKKLL
ncbi:hypothetical protein FLA_3711 [Filimonas lacunae]|nr:hypothetical protein FLA_3711 [Filimonas lacunae]